MVDFKLYYWPKLAGRAEFIRVIFAEAGKEYTEINDNIYELVKGGKLGGYPAYAVPVLQHGDLQISQTPTICKYLGKEFGLYPDNKTDEWHADQVNNTIHDFIGEGRLVFHGRCFIESYYTQIEETKPYIEWFLRERFEKWLLHFEMVLATNKGGSGFLFGNSITYADLGLLHVLRASESQFNDAWNSLTSIPLLKAFKQRMEQRPNLASYFKSDRCKPFEGNSMM